MIRALVALLLATTVLAGCSDSATVPEVEVRRVSPAAASRLVDNGATPIDVRTPEEFQARHLAGALNYDVQSDAFRTDVGILNRDTTYVVYCRSGARAGAAARMMGELGFTRVVNAGGFEELAAAGLETTGPR